MSINIRSSCKTPTAYIVEALSEKKAQTYQLRADKHEININMRSYLNK